MALNCNFTTNAFVGERGRAGGPAAGPRPTFADANTQITL